jgi:hypothetical protein
LLPGDPTLALYPGATNFDFDFGGYVATGVAGGLGGTLVQIDNNAGFDRFIASKTCNGTCTGAMVDTFVLASITFNVEGPPSVFPDDSLPTSLDLTDFTGRSASLAFSDGSVGPQVGALLESLTVTVTVPEPAALALLACAALGSVALRRV